MDYLLYGLRKENTERWQEELMLSCGKSEADQDKVIALASKQGWHSFRKATFNGEKPDFTKVLNNKRSAK